MPFRTAKEAVELGNNTRYGLAASVWTDNVSLALEVALLLKAGSVWVNSHNLFDAAAGFGGYRQSGFGRDGGKEVCLITALYISLYACTLTPSMPSVPNCCCSEASAPYWSTPPFLIFDIRALWRSVLSARAPECQKLKMVG